MYAFLLFSSFNWPKLSTFVNWFLGSLFLFDIILLFEATEFPRFPRIFIVFVFFISLFIFLVDLDLLFLFFLIRELFLCLILIFNTIKFLFETSNSGWNFIFIASSILWLNELYPLKIKIKIIINRNKRIRDNK